MSFYYFTEFTQQAIKRVGLNYDLVIAVSGYEGTGKTSWAIHAAMKMDKNFTLENNILYNPKYQELVNKIYRLPKYSVIIIDEAIKVMYKRKWMRGLQIKLNQIFSICRKENKINLVCIPRFFDLDEYYRNHRVLLWAFVIDRGYAVIFKKDWSPFAKDPWHRDSNERLMKKLMKKKKVVDISTQQKISYLSRAPNYFCTIRFPKLPKKIEDRYLELNRTLVPRFDIEEEDERGRAKRYRDATQELISLIYKKGILKQKDLAKLINVDVSTINDMLKEKKSRKIDQPKKP